MNQPQNKNTSISDPLKAPSMGEDWCPSADEDGSPAAKEGGSKLRSEADALGAFGQAVPGRSRISNMSDDELNASANLAFEAQPSPAYQKRDAGQTQRFSDAFLERLPPLLAQACQVLTSQTEKEVFFVGALGVISGVLPNVGGYYDGRVVGPNLYIYIVAGYGVGKGGLEFARYLGAAIHASKRSDYERAAQEHEQQKQQYEQGKKAARTKSTPPQAHRPPATPPNWMLYVPANSSKTGLYQVLYENDGQLIMFETEGDTLADTIRQDYANFSDGLRKAFHHEAISYFRRSNGGEYVEINHPRLSLVLSSTYDQLKSLIPSPENGLFSRFLFYQLEGTAVFKNVFDQRKQNYSAYFEAVGSELKHLYDHLSTRSRPLLVALTDGQQEQFLIQFQRWKTQLRDDVGAELDGLVNRLGLICFRIAMLYTVLRAWSSGTLPDGETADATLKCHDVDFENALSTVDVLRGHALSVWSRLPRSTDPLQAEEADAVKLEQKQRCRELRRAGASVREIARQVLGSEARKTTVARWISE